MERFKISPCYPYSNAKPWRRYVALRMAGCHSTKGQILGVYKTQKCRHSKMIPEKLYYSDPRDSLTSMVFP